MEGNPAFKEYTPYDGLAKAAMANWKKEFC